VGSSDLVIYEVGGERPHDSAPPASPIGRWRRLARSIFAPLMLWALAAAGAVIAPFTVLLGYHETFRPDGTITTETFTQHTDGWGRARSFSSGGIPLSFGHDVRYGVATCACAVLLLAAVLAALAASAGSPIRARWSTRLVPVLALVATSLLAGVVAAMALNIEATKSQYTSHGGPASGAVPQFRVQVGPCVWLALAAVGAGIAGLALFAWTRREHDARHKPRATR
jgi:hypothetical protein